MGTACGGQVVAGRASKCQCGWRGLRCHRLTVDSGRHRSLPDFEGDDLDFWTDRRGVEPLFGEVAVAVLMGDRMSDPGSYVGDVTGVELAFLVAVTDLVDDPGRLVREDVVGEGGDPGRAGVVDRADAAS